MGFELPGNWPVNYLKYAESASAPLGGAAMLSALPDELLYLLLFSQIDAKTACRLSQTSHSWQLWFMQNNEGFCFAWLHHRALLSWLECARRRMMQRRGRRSWLMSLFATVQPRPQMFSASESERLFSSAGLRVRCTCCEAILSVPLASSSAASVNILLNHLKAKHASDGSAVMQRARALRWL